MCCQTLSKRRYLGSKTIKEVRWVMPPHCWTKANIDGTTRGNPGEAACGGVFRMYMGFVKGCFS